MKKLNVTFEGRITCRDKLVGAVPMDLPRMLSELEIKELDESWSKKPASADAYAVGDKIEIAPSIYDEGCSRMILFHRPVQFYRILEEK